MNFAEARCWPLPCLWVQQGTQNLCITSMLIVDLTHASEQVKPCNLGKTAHLGANQRGLGMETINYDRVEPLARWQHF